MSEILVTGGAITCEEFVDANGKKYKDLIPAIKLYSAGAAIASSSISDDMAHAGGVIEPSATYCYLNISQEMSLRRFKWIRLRKT